MIGRVKRALRRGMLAGSLVLAIMGAVGLVGATTALADTGYTISRYAGQADSAGGATPGPALSSKLSFVVGAGLDPAGNLYIVDPNNVAVEKVTPGGTLSILAGTGQSGPPVPGPASNSTLNNPAGVASDSAGNLYIADQGNHAIEKIATDGTLSVFAGIPGVTGLPAAGPATSSHLNNPDAIATDSADNVYIADFGNRVVEKVTPSGQLSVIAGIPGSAGTPTPGPATSTHLYQANGVAVDSAGNVYVADGGPNVIAKVTPGGTLSIIAGISGTSAQPTPGLATASALSDPNGVGVDAAGAVYVADPGANVIEKITAAGQLSVIAGNGSAGHPTYGGLATATSLDLPLAMVVDPAGNVYVADALNFTMDRLTPPAPVSTAGPAITGAAQVGQTLSTDGGSWDNAPFTETYQWQRCDSGGAGCTTIPSATSASYPVTDADGGHTIRVVVTASNGGGPSNVSSAATALVGGDATGATPAPDPSPTPDPSPPAATATAQAVLATTGSVARGPASLSATLTGEVSPSTAPVTYRFDYGTRASYGRSTRSQTLAASNVAQAVGAKIRGLVPGTVYHYRVVATTPSGTSYGQDATLATPKAEFRRVRGRITPYRATGAPYRYRLRGWMFLPSGLTRSVACRSGGSATVTVTRDAKVLATRRVHVSTDCSYDTTVVFTAAQLPGYGHLSFRTSFSGNRQLAGGSARTLHARFG